MSEAWNQHTDAVTNIGGRVGRPCRCGGAQIEAYGLADGGPPLFFEVHEQLLPTLYTLWHMPHMLPQLHTYSEVSPKVGFAGACVWPPCEVSRQVAKLLREQNSFRPVEITSFASRDLIVGLHKFT